MAGNGGCLTHDTLRRGRDEAPFQERRRPGRPRAPARIRARRERGRAHQAPDAPPGARDRARVGDRPIGDRSHPPTSLGAGLDDDRSAEGPARTAGQCERRPARQRPRRPTTTRSLDRYETASATEGPLASRRSRRPREAQGDRSAEAEGRRQHLARRPLGRRARARTARRRRGARRRAGGAATSGPRRGRRRCRRIGGAARSGAAAEPARRARAEGAGRGAGDRRRGAAVAGRRAGGRAVAAGGRDRPETRGRDRGRAPRSATAPRPPRRSDRPPPCGSPCPLRPSSTRSSPCTFPPTRVSAHAEAHALLARPGPPGPIRAGQHARIERVDVGAAGGRVELHPDRDRPGGRGRRALRRARSARGARCRRLMPQPTTVTRIVPRAPDPGAGASPSGTMPRMSDLADTVSEAVERSRGEARLRRRRRGRRPARRSRMNLNSAVAISVAITATFVALCNVKDGNIVQAMQQAQASAIDAWAYYQAKGTKLNIAESALDALRLQRDTGGARAHARGARARRPQDRRLRAEDPPLRGGEARDQDAAPRAFRRSTTGSTPTTTSSTWPRR